MSHDHEVQEAISAGKKALSAVQRARSACKSATTASWFDMLAGGLFASLYKHSKVQDVQNAIHEVELTLAGFADEFRDVSPEKVSSIEISSIESFLDIGFDNIFSDWIVHKKISEMSDALEELENEIQNALAKLSE